MTVQRRFKRMLIEDRDGFHLLLLGEMEIWDGADLALLREGLFRLIVTATDNWARCAVPLIPRP